MPSPNDTNTSRLLLMTVPGWGQSLPDPSRGVLAARLVSEGEDRPANHVYHPEVFLKNLASRSPAAQERILVPSSSFLQRIRLISIFQETETNLVETFWRLVTAYPAAYQTLAEEEPIACSTTGASFDPAPAPGPVAVICDYFLLSPSRATRALTVCSTVRIIAFDPLGSATFLRDWGLEAVGGPGDFGVKVDAEVARTGKSTLEVGNESYHHLDGSVIRVSGLPAMYDHESFPQKWPTPILIRSGVDFAKESDALLIAPSDAYEKAPLDAVRAWFAESQKPVYAIGPLLPAGYTAAQSDVED